MVRAVVATVGVAIMAAVVAAVIVAVMAAVISICCRRIDTVAALDSQQHGHTMFRPGCAMFVNLPNFSISPTVPVLTEMNGQHGKAKKHSAMVFEVAGFFQRVRFAFRR